MIMQLPKRFTADTFHTIWTEISEITFNYEGAKEVFFDMSNLEFIDPEGSNYIALVPNFLSIAGKSVYITLPKKYNVLNLN